MAIDETAPLPATIQSHETGPSASRGRPLRVLPLARPEIDLMDVLLAGLNVVDDGATEVSTSHDHDAKFLRNRTICQHSIFNAKSAGGTTDPDVMVRTGSFEFGWY